MAFHASSYVKTTTATVTRVRDQLSFPFTARPQAMTVYVRFVELGTAMMANFTGVWSVGLNVDPRFGIEKWSTGNVYAAIHKNVAGTAVTSIAAASPSQGDIVELLATLSATGAVTLTQSINGTVATAATSGNLVLPTAWSSQAFQVGGKSTVVGHIGVRNIWVGRGIHDLAACRRFAGV